MKLKLLGLLALSAFSCKKLSSDWKKVDIVNNSSHDIYVVPGYGPLWSMYAYPQTSIPSNKPNLTRIEKESVGGIYSGLAWEDIFAKMPKDTLCFYFFNADSVDQKPWSEIQRKKMLLVRKDFTLTTLQEAGFKIYYP